jgi:Spy/CpxP family protein refolding chaperone
MKRKLIAAAAAAFLAAPAWAHGPGMMGYGAQGMGPGMMGPEMMAPGMMAPGMMGGGMMGGGMMGGYDPRGMGPGMMGGYAALDLTDEQRARIADVRREAARKQWALMSNMHEQQLNMHELFDSGKLDESAARKAYDQMAAARKQMFETMLEARKGIDSVLTDEQRKQLERAGRSSAWGG